VTRVKICGITNLDDAELAVQCGAWSIGLIFHPASPRAAAPEAGEVIGAAMKRRVEVAGVFVNEPLDQVAAMADLWSLTILQLHGDEGPVYCREAARRTGCKIMKATRVKDASSLQALSAFHVDYHLVDTHTEDLYGGTGRTFDWELLRKWRSPVPLVLSGGLTPENVGEAIAVTHPFAVDTASGTEAEPGRKDPGKVKAFFKAVEAASWQPA
jgi:phosphoribosylanthranilate isomerase